MSIGRILDISVRSLSAYQRAINVTSNNIANAGNTDYSRQTVVLGTEIGDSGSGSGVKIMDIRRIRDEMIDTQIRKYNSSFSDAEKRSELLARIETIVAEPSENGLSNYMTEFFNSWQELTTNPTSVQLRSNVLQKSKRMAERYNDLKSGITEVQAVTLKDANLQVSQLNSYLKEIKSLNQKVYDSEARGISANELKDQREAIIGKLSEIVNISVFPAESGALVVNVGGLLGADHMSVNEFEMQSINGKLKLVPTNDPSSSGAVLNGGSLYAATDLYSNKIPEYLTAFENLSSTLVERVNYWHEKGITLDQAPGQKFFEMSSDGKLVLLISDPKKIAAADQLGNIGNGKIASNIAGISSSDLAFNGNLILDDYTNILNSIGLEKVGADDKIDSNELILQQLENQRASVSGVSLDEEMTNVLKYQRSYDASAKLIKVADELIQTILSLV